MNLSYIIGETLLMAGFTFIVGIAFAYALKLTTFFFSRLNGHDLPVLLRKSRIWERAYRMNVAHTYRTSARSPATTTLRNGLRRRTPA